MLCFKRSFFVAHLGVLRNAKLNVEDVKTLSVWDKPQINLKCCGLGGYADWRGAKPNSGVVPDSCCRVYKPGCGKNFTLESIYQTGCDQKLSEYMGDQYFIQIQNQQSAYQKVSVVFFTWAILITFFSLKACCDHSWSEILWRNSHSVEKMTLTVNPEHSSFFMTNKSDRPDRNKRQF